MGCWGPVLKRVRCSPRSGGSMGPSRLSRGFPPRSPLGFNGSVLCPRGSRCRSPRTRGPSCGVQGWGESYVGPMGCCLEAAQHDSRGLVAQRICQIQCSLPQRVGQRWIWTLALPCWDYWLITLQQGGLGRMDTFTASRLAPSVGIGSISGSLQQHPASSRHNKIVVLIGATVATMLVPAVVLVVGWVALECHSESGRCEQN